MKKCSVVFFWYCFFLSHTYTQGDIITCAGTHLYVWTINGELLVQENTSPAITGQIHCCIVSTVCNDDHFKNFFCLCCFDNVVKAFLRNLVSLALNAKKGRSMLSSIADNVLNYLKVFYCCCCYYYFYVVQWMGRTECYCYWFSWRSCQGNVNKANLNLLMWVNDVKVNPLGCANIL